MSDFNDFDFRDELMLREMQLELPKPPEMPDASRAEWVEFPRDSRDDPYVVDIVWMLRRDWEAQIRQIADLTESEDAATLRTVKALCLAAVLAAPAGLLLALVIVAVAR